MDYIDNIHSFPSYIKKFFLAFILCLSIGYFTGMNFVRSSTNMNAKGIESNYLGNEDDEAAETMQFKKSEREMLATIHTHILSFSMIFFMVGAILIAIPMRPSLKNFLLFEPFISTVVTFGGIWFLWNGMIWIKYLIMFSGALLTFTYLSAVIIIIKHCLRPSTTPS